MIRPLSDDDYAKTIHFWASMVGYSMTRDEYQTSLSALMRQPPERHQVALCEDEIVGTLICIADNHAGWVRQLVVAPEYQDQGLEHALHEACVIS